ncbi:hypothetical protein WJX74_000152 [Apatococcus lobatus]|uniref:Non-specific serine/threonine protein kinase n=1 Tax=Apatococcus lobatus TaxID=904363 RepID=A0AAW1S230_9CHLO
MSLRACLAELQDCTGPDRLDAASEAWEKVVKVVQENVKAQPFDVLTFKLLSETLPGFLTKSFSAKGKSASKLHTIIFKWLASYLEEPGHAGLQKAAASFCKACIYCFKRTESNPCRSEIVRCTEPLLEALASEADPQLSELGSLLQTTYQRDRKISKTLRGDMFQCLGHLIEAAPMVFQAGTFSYKWLLSETHTVLKKQLKAENQELMLLAGAIAGLASALSVSKEDEGQDVEELAFRLLHQSIQQVEELKRYHALRSSLHLLDLQAWRFKKQILADAQGLTERLGKMTMHQNQSLRDAAGLALEAVLAQVAEEMAKQPQTHQELYSKMMGSVTQKLISPKSSNPEKTVAMRTIGALAKATHAIYGIPGIQKVMVHLPQTDQGQDEMEDKIAFNEVVLLQALTQHMIYLKATDESRLQQCLRAVTGISARYGQLWPKQRPRVHQPLCDLLSAASSQPGCLQIVLPRLVSTLLQHTLKPEEIADQQAGQEENIDLEPIWTKFMPLWLALLAPEQGSSLVDKDHIVQALYNGLIQAVLEILPVLDLARSNVVAQENFGPSSQMTFTSTCISYCRKYPFLSGFYRLLTSALRCLNSAQSPGKGADCTETLEQARKALAAFLSEVTIASSMYRDELLAASLELLLAGMSMGHSLLSPKAMSVPLQKALQIGLQQPRIAEIALVALESCASNVAAPLAPLLGPSINPYLTPVSLKHHVGPTATAEEQAEGEDDEAEISAKQSARDIENNAAAAATRDADSLKEGLNVLQPRFLQWLGRLGGAADCMLMQHPLLRARSELAAPDAPTLSGFSDGAWRGMQDLLGLSVYFEGSSEAVTVWLDCLLPQVADRAEKSPDRSCRVAACEFVHASILWMLGATADRTAGETSEDDAAPTKFHKVMQCLYPIVIRLAASAEPIAQQLFEPLLMQLAHYFTRSQAREAAATLALLDAVTDGLANATSAGVRDLCASATHELLEWSMRHRPKIDGSSKQPVSSYAILIMRRMYERLSHPEPYMRLGASKAMQRCVLAMRKHRSLAEDTCLEALRHCIMSLQQAADDHVQLGAIAAAREAIRGLTGLLTGGEGSDDLLAALKHADPVTKKASKMDDFIVWVWRQIICTNRYVREACMWILKHLCDLWKPESSMDDDQSGIASWVDELAKNNPEEIDSVKQALVLREPMPVAARAEALKLWLQELDAAVHCMAWMLQQTAMAASELLPADEITKPHAALQLLTFFDKYADVGLTEVPALTAHEGENTLERITYHGLQWLQQVIAEPFLDSYLDIVAKFVTVVLFQPSLLGLAQSNDVALSRMTLLAQELLQTADSRRPALLPSLQQQLRPTVERMLLEPKAAPEFSRQTHPVSADLMRGFQTIQQLQLPAKSSLISQEVLSKLPERLLEWAAGITAHAAAHQRTAAAQGLQLAIQLGLPNQPMLNVLLDPKAGEGFFVAYQIPVQAWVLFNNEASCKALGPALAGTDQSRVAEVVLSGTLQMLQQSKASNDGRSDPRQRSFLQSLLRHLGINSGSTNSPSNDAMLRLLRQMLTLDALTVLNPTGSELTDLVDYFVSILALRGPMHAHLKREALGLLPQLFSLPEVQMQRVMDALADLANDSFPSSSHDLQEGSTQETEYRRLLLLIMSGAVRAAEDKRDVSSLLEAMLPVLRELGEGEGHRYQDALRTRLALIAAAPWKGVDLAAADPASLVGMMDSEPQEAVHGQECMLQKQSFDQASAQAKAMFAYAWRYAMAANGQPLALRQAMMEYLLLPCLQYAPQVFISRTIQESIRNLMDVVNCKLGEWQPLRGDPEANLVAKAAAYRLLRIMYLALPVADIKETILEPFGGHKAVMQKAAADMKTLELDSRGALSKQARQAAYVCACSLMIASQTKEPLFKALLEKPETWARIVDTSRELDFQKQQRAIDSPSFHRREAAMQSRAALLRSSLSASMASSMMTSLSFGASIGGSIAGSSQLLTGSQQSSGPAVSLRQMTQDSLSMPFVDREQMAVPDAALQDALPTNEDDLDAEPVMLAAAQLVERAATLFEGGDGDTMPSWMQSLHLLAGSAETPAYLRLFLIKLVIHVDRRHVDRAASQPEVMLPDESGNPPPSIFAKYACQWFGPMVDVLTLGKSQEAGIHYMLRDAILVLLSWPSLWPPIGKNAQLTRSAAACLMEHLVKSAHSESAQVTKSNCDYIRVIASKWRAFNPISVAAILTHLSVAVPKDGERKALHAVVSRRALGMKLLCVGLLDREQAVPMLADPDMQGTICQVIQSLTLKGGQRFAEQTGETIGILLLRLTKQSSSTPDTEVVQQIWQETRQSLVAIHRSGQDDRFLFALDRLSSRHKSIVADLRLQVASSLARCSSLLKSVALKILTRLATADPETLWSEILPQLPMLLGRPPVSVQNTALQLCKQLMQTVNLTAQQVSSHFLSHSLPAFENNSSPDCQLSFFEVFSEVWQLHPQLQDQLKGPLLRLLGTPSTDLRKRVLRFWNSVLPATLPERLVSLIQLPTDLGPVQRQRFGAHWAQSSALLMMELTNAHDNSRKPIYKKDLGNCTFVDYSVDTMRSGTHSTAPMFSPQWTASQATYNPSMSGSQTTQAISQGAPGMVHATQSHSRISQSFSLAPLGGDTLALSGKTSGSHSPSKSPHKATLYRRPNSRPSAGFSGMLGRIRRRQELRAAQEKARTSKVTLARQYRVGDLPDVQSITPESFLSPLGSMIASDKQMAQLAFGMLAASAMHDPACSPEMEDLQQELHTALSGALALHPADTQQLECLLEVAMGGNGIRLPINDVAQAAKKAGCLHSGIRLIEDSLLTDANSVARQQTGGRSRMQKHAAEHAVVPGVSCDMDSWAQLAALYKEAGFDHLTQVAYSSHITRCPATKEALQAVSSRRLNDAFTLFESLMRAAIEEEMEVEGVQHADEVQGPSKLQLMAGKEPSAQEEDLWFRERNRCMEMLGEWDDLLLVIDDEIKEDTARLFADGVERQFLRPYLRASLSSPAGQDRIKPLFDLGLASPDNARLVQQVAPVEHAAQTLLLKQWDRCHGTLKACMSVFTDRWTSLSPLDVSQRLQALSLLQPLTEAQEALTVLGISSTQLEPSSINGGHLHNLITSWQARWPSNQHADPHATLAVITMREILLGLLLPLSQRQGTLKECQALQTPCQSPWQVVTGLRNSLLLGGARSLGEQGFIDTAQDLITKHQAAAEDNDIQSSALQLRLRIEQVKAAADTPQWLLQRLAEESAGVAQAADHQADGQGHNQTPSRCELLILRGVAQTELATAAQVGLRTKPGVQQQHLSEAVQCLTKAVGEGAAASAAEAGGAMLQLARLCHVLLQAAAGSDDEFTLLSDEAAGAAEALLNGKEGVALTLVESILGALKHGSQGQEAQLLIPVLMEAMHKSKAARQAWECHWQGVPIHLLLPWAAQMLSLLDQPEGSSFLPTLKAIAGSYKQALYFPFRLSQEHWGTVGRENGKALGPLLQSEVMQQWATALGDIVFPLQRWQGWMEKLGALMAESRQAEALELYVGEVLQSMAERHNAGGSRAARATRQPMAATVNSKAAPAIKKLLETAFGVGGMKLRKMDAKAFNKAAWQIRSSLTPDDKDRTMKPGRRELASLASWFNTYNANPGKQPTEPLLMPWMPSAQTTVHGPPEQVEIVGFSKDISVFESKQRPIKLTIYGSNFRSHEYIVKGGEDVRIDQRIQQLFSMMNSQLQEHSGASAHHLKVTTYDVIPFSPALGLVAFVPGTRPLIDLCGQSADTLKDTLIGQHQASICRLAKQPAAQGWPKIYDAVHQQVSPDDAAQSLHQLQSKLQWDGFREVMLRLAGGAAEFLIMRSNYLASLAAVSMCGYIAGSGDRHSANILLDLQSGALVPIDFGFSFGSHVQVLPIPELTPFRLTRQMVGPLFPHDTVALLQDPCTLGLAALAAAKQSLLGVMGVFLREPLLEWQREARTLGLHEGSSNNQDGFSSLKVKHAEMKLDGRHPAEIMVRELTPMHGKKTSWKGLQKIVWGDRAVQQPAGLNGALSAGQQAECLLRQATDPHLLFCSWTGWRPWL